MASKETIGAVLLTRRYLLQGIVSLFEFHGSADQELIEDIRAQYQTPPTILTAEESIRSTWKAVGDRMRWAMTQYDSELEEKEEERATVAMVKTGRSNSAFCSEGAPFPMTCSTTYLRKAARNFCEP